MTEAEYIQHLDNLYPQLIEAIRQELGNPSPQLVEDTLRNLADKFAAENELEPSGNES